MVLRAEISLLSFVFTQSAIRTVPAQYGFWGGKESSEEILAAAWTREIAKARACVEIHGSKYQESGHKCGVALREQAFQSSFRERHEGNKREELDAYQDAKPRSTCSVRSPLAHVSVCATITDIIRHDKPILLGTPQLGKSIEIQDDVLGYHSSLLLV
ncbi:MAG TPA: hypothetical protein VMF56_12435 [Acidobacteriaceae bacterium]|nr:hypothetical protein [Acidobacteriaceae bacterium]